MQSLGANMSCMEDENGRGLPWWQFPYLQKQAVANGNCLLRRWRNDYSNGCFSRNDSKKRFISFSMGAPKSRTGEASRFPLRLMSREAWTRI
jgi:hypothetical protein